MRNVPTELLRALVAVVDLKGYTRAGERLGRTQPAISYQLRRLQEIVGVPLFRRVDGASQLTERGELVAHYARRILALNDELLLRLASSYTNGKLRIGMPNDYADHLLPRFLQGFAFKRRQAGFDVVCDISEKLLAGLRDHAFDLVVAMTSDGPSGGAYMSWRESLSWVGLPRACAPKRAEIPIVAYPEGCVYRRHMLAAMQRTGRSFQIVYTSPSLAGIEAAVRSGFGITALATRVIPPKLQPLSRRLGLPGLADVSVGVYLRNDRKPAELETPAACFAKLFMNPRSRVA
ncbi:MAG: LysR family transcriptional regulator [Alphaproteobacteria bacterium]|nr:LysR family transcriptional regulator [Alphaproteobacteria bacterium]